MTCLGTKGRQTGYIFLHTRALQTRDGWFRFGPSPVLCAVCCGAAVMHSVHGTIQGAQASKCGLSMGSLWALCGWFC
jgi:hypothetical protein